MGEAARECFFFQFFCCFRWSVTIFVEGWAVVMVGLSEVCGEFWVLSDVCGWGHFILIPADGAWVAMGCEVCMTGIFFSYRELVETGN